MATERTYIMIKPDGVQRGLVGEIITRFEKKGYVLKALKMQVATQAQMEAHYADLKEKKFFPGLVAYMISGPVVCMVWEGKDAILGGRRLLGATKPSDSAVGTIRGDYAIDVVRFLPSWALFMGKSATPYLLRRGLTIPLPPLTLFNFLPPFFSFRGATFATGLTGLRGPPRRSLLGFLRVCLPGRATPRAGSTSKCCHLCAISNNIVNNKNPPPSSVNALILVMPPPSSPQPLLIFHGRHSHIVNCGKASYSCAY
jgi:nucleoside-diphosphate kinase